MFEMWQAVDGQCICDWCYGFTIPIDLNWGLEYSSAKQSWCMLLDWQVTSRMTHLVVSGHSTLYVLLTKKLVHVAA